MMKNEDELWKKLIELSLFDEFFPQKINAAFKYLDTQSNNTFSVRDMIEKGYYIFTYLGIDIPKDSKFALMDLFRIFDKDGKGEVNIEQFAIGIIEKLNSLYHNTKLLEDISNEVLEIDNRSIELSARLEKEMNLVDKLALYKLYLRSYNHVIRDRLKLNKIPNLTVQAIQSIFQESILQVIKEVFTYFHISTDRLISGKTTGTNDIMSHYLINDSSQLAYNVWNFPQNHTNSNKVDDYLNDIINTNNDLLKQQQQQQQVKNDNIDHKNRSRTHSRSGIIHCNNNNIGGESSNNLVTSTAGEDFSKTNALLSENSNSIQATEKELLESSNAMILNHINNLNNNNMVDISEDCQVDIDDRNQLYVLQSAFRSIESFFTLQDSEDNQQPQLGSINMMMKDNNTTSNNNNINTTTNNTISNITSSSPKHVSKVVLSHNNKETISLKSITSLSTNANYKDMINKKEDSTVVLLNSGFEYDLAEHLVQAQETLRKIRIKMNILEMIQDEAVYNSSSNAVDIDEYTSVEDVYIDKHPSHSSILPLPTSPVTAPIVPILATTSTAASMAAVIIEETTKESNITPSSPILTYSNNNNIRSDMEIAKEIGNKWGKAASSFDGIMSELTLLKACLVERTTASYPLGLFLEKERVAVIVEDHNNNNNNNNNNSNIIEPNNNNNDIQELDNQDNKTKLENNKQLNISDKLKFIKDNVQQINDHMNIKNDNMINNQNTLLLIKKQENEIAEYKMLLEQSDISRNEYIALNVELQLLRDRNLRKTKDEGQLKLLQLKNMELSQHAQQLEEEMHEFKHKRNKEFDNKSDSKRVHELRSRLQQMITTKDSQVAEIDRLQKEIHRLKSAVIVSEQRVRGSLQDQMNLHHQLQQLEEDNMTSKANNIKLTRELEDHKFNRSVREETERKISELQRELQKRDMELAEAREEANMAAKYQMELLTAEKNIEHLEITIGELSVELEKGHVALLQLDKYREQIQLKSKENRDMSLQIHALENQLQEVPYLQLKYDELKRELEDSKFKVDQLPGLLSEQARLRGSSRASVKALQEQDKILNQLKQRITQLERDNAMLKNDNRSMQDLEIKLKEANHEIKRLMSMVTEVNNLKKGLQTAEEEKKSFENQQKKIKKFIRQSVLVTSAPNSTSNNI